MVYLDYNATTPLAPQALEAMMPFLKEEFGNPSSIHAGGRRARAAIDDARDRIAACLGAKAGDIVFTGGGTESCNLAILGLARAHVMRGRHIITSSVEHHAVLHACEYLKHYEGYEVTVLPVDRYGRVNPEDLNAAITPQTTVVSIMHANNETGVRQPVEQIARVARDRGVLIHCDAAQSVGKVDVDVTALGVDLLTLVGHKMYAPKGVAALVVAPGVVLRPVTGGGGQEDGLRAGTENVASIVGLGAAAEIARHALAAGEAARLGALRDDLARRLGDALPGRVRVNGEHAPRLPTTLSVRIAGIAARRLVDRVPGVAASAGSACHSGVDAPSPVLTAMGLPAAPALETIRLSVGRWTTLHDIERAAADLAAAAAA